MASGLLTLWLVDFTSIISHERGSFAGRIIEMAFYTLLPAALGSLLFMLRNFGRRALMLPAVLLVAFLGTASLYFSFPHSDKFQTSKLYSLSSADLAAIELVEKDAAGKPYVTLANQMTSAGALARFGFSRFHETPQGELYFYPIPTASPLYPIYLNMAEGIPSLKAIEQARQLIGVDAVYMIFDSYWTNFEAQKEKIAPLASEVFEIEDGQSVVFKF
jgi:hypothetical protein